MEIEYIFRQKRGETGMEGLNGEGEGRKGAKGGNEGGETNTKGHLKGQMETHYSRSVFKNIHI